jgi:hypothetical protein
MPTPIIAACFVIGAALSLVNYAQRFIGLHDKKYQIHPFPVFSWLFNDILRTIFLFATLNSVLAAQMILSLILTSTLLVWGTYNLIKTKQKLWRITWSDGVCLTLAIGATIFFYFTHDAITGAAVVFAASVISIIPLMRKNFVAPQTDLVRVHLVSVIQYVVLFGTLQTINLVGLFTTLFWAAIEAISLAWLLFCRRRKVSASASTVQL